MKKKYNFPFAMLFMVFLCFPITIVFPTGGEDENTNLPERIFIMSNDVTIISNENPSAYEFTVDTVLKRYEDPLENRSECEYMIELWDDYGDGWDEAFLDVYVDGILVLPGITLEADFGPAVFTLPVHSGALIQIEYFPGGWPLENYYYVYDSQGNLVLEDGMGHTTPIGGEIIADCGGCEHTIELYDDWGDGWNGCTLDVLVDGQVVLSQLTILDGYGPETYSFQVYDGALVNFNYFPAIQGYPWENSYVVNNNAGEKVFEDGTGGQQPVGGEIQAHCLNTNVSNAFLRVGPYLWADPWLRWVSAHEETHVQLLASDPDNEIMYVNFYVSPDGNEWGYFAGDFDNSEPYENTFGDSSGEGDGWSAVLPPAIVPMGSDGLFCRAEVVLNNDESFLLEKRIDYDYTPPSGIEMDVIDWMIIEDDSVCLDIDPGLCIDLSYVEITLVAKADTFAKGIPPISQQPHSANHCAPTAAAACLKYFEGQGDNQICGGLNDFDLVQALAGVCNTSSNTGTKVSNLANGLRQWIAAHGNGYTLRGPLPFNWQQMRNELEKCQDVLSGIYWPNGGGHRMAFNSIINRPDPETGLIRVDFMDPWTGDIEYGFLNPQTGQMTGFTGAGNSGELGNIIIICPKEPTIIPNTGTVIYGPDPPVQCLPTPMPSPFNPALFFLRIFSVDNSGHRAAFDLVIDYQPDLQSNPFLCINNKQNPEPWHNWLGGPDTATVPIQLLGMDPDDGIISNVEFYYSMDGGVNWELFYTDDDGTEPLSDSFGTSENEGDGWTGYISMDDDPFGDEMDVYFMAKATFENGGTMEATNSTFYNPTPPSAIEMNVYDWMEIDGDEFLLEIFPGECIDLEYVEVEVIAKLDTFQKGIPLLNQRPISDFHCTPTAAAACLKYFANEGDQSITGGLNDDDLIEALAQLMKTWQNGGTYPSDLANGLRKWVQDHGDNYTVSGPRSFNWQQMRNELERCQDVIANIYWPNGGGHSMTFNSIINRPVNDLIQVDFMDPWTGEIEWGWCNPQTGWVNNFTGAGSSGELDNIVYVCPKEESITPGTGIIIYEPFPAIPITLPAPVKGLYFLRIKAVDAQQNVARFDFVLNKVENRDWGDAPEGIEVIAYPTTALHNGANHKIVAGVHLGGSVDAEPDGQPSPAAVKDDNKPFPSDEDGVQFLTSLVPGELAKIRVYASVDGYLNAWLDFDRNLDWAGEKIFSDKLLIAGPNVLTFSVPSTASVGTTFARFRYTTYNTYDSLSYKGPADDGEVIDQLIEVVSEEDKSKMHRPQLPNLTTDGVDVYCMEGESGKIVLADDFMCMETGLITDIHIWGSWLNDVVPWNDMPMFKLGIWSDNPNGPAGYSQPAELLCEFAFEQDQYSMDLYAEVPDDEWFYWPHLGNAQFPGDSMVYKLNFYIPESQICMQDSGTIYWLSVNVMANAGANYEFGWKSSRYHFNDFAVWQIDTPDWEMLCYPNEHPLGDICMDMAFYISGHPPVTPEIRIKDCPLDNGSVPSNINCPQFWGSWDIWIDNDGDGFRDAPVVGAANNLYARARNDGPGVASNVSIDLYYRNNTTGLTYPAGAPYIGTISGLTILPNDSASGFVSWTVPPPPDSAGHYCIGAVVSAPYDPQTSIFVPQDNNVACVNIGYLYWRAGLAAKDDIEASVASFYVRNPYDYPELFNVETSWVWPPEMMPEYIDANGFPIDLPYMVLLEPLEEQLITMIVNPPAGAQDGDEAFVELTQSVVDPSKQKGDVIGGMNFPLMVDLYPPEAITDLEVTEIRAGTLLSWTPATLDIAGNPDNIACYNIYKWPDTLDRVARVAVSGDYPIPKFNWIDQDPAGNPIYIVRVEDEAGYESENSNLAYISEAQPYYFTGGWRGISSYLNPVNPDVEAMFSDLVDVNKLIILLNHELGAYWPGEFNTLVNWDSQYGYAIKISGDAAFNIWGVEVTDKTVDITAYQWKIIPVLGRIGEGVAGLFSTFGNQCVVKSIGDSKVYWPLYNINTIGNVEPGDAFFVYSTISGTITFTTKGDNLSSIEIPEFVNTTPWNDVHYSPYTHVVAFTKEVVSSFETGDVIGAFTAEGVCAGMVEYLGSEIALSLSGDDIYTDEADGFVGEDYISYRLYRPLTAQMFDVDVVYDPNYDNTGLYHENSLSAVIDLKLTAMGVHDPIDANIYIYPNPTAGTFTIEGLVSEAEVEIYSSYGKLVFARVIMDEELIDLRTLPKGVYLVKVIDAQGTHFEKLVLK